MCGVSITAFWEPLRQLKCSDFQDSLTRTVHGVQILRGVLTPVVHMASLSCIIRTIASSSDPFPSLPIFSIFFSVHACNVEE